MSGRWRVRRVAKWGLVAVCIGIFFVWFATVSIVGENKLLVMYVGHGVQMVLANGFIEAGQGTVDPTIVPGLYVGWANPSPELPWAYRFGMWSPSPNDTPLWLCFLLAAIPAALWFWLDRRRRPKPGHCRTCGYDLTGNVSGVCPECGCKIGQEK